MIRQVCDAPSSAPPLGFIDRTARRFVTAQLAEVRGGTIHLQHGGRTTAFGSTGDLAATIAVHRPRFFRRAVLGGTLSVAESYLQGDWDCDDLTALFRIFVRNRATADGFDRGAARLVGLLHRGVHWLRSNTRAGSRRNIAAHYDLGNEFYRLWLDETLAYSSGIFGRPDASLAAASTEKIDRVCRKLDLRPDDELLEIGTGWGGFALHAATHYGCRVTTTTISQQQYETARERVAASDVAERIQLLQTDYRDLQGRFDKLASIEMVEAVGHRFFDTYFRRCGELLRPDGTFVVQAIVMPERGYDQYVRSVDFIQRYVFPGGCLPSVGAMLESAARTSDLRVVHLEDFAPHYAETLRRWRAAFQARLDDVRALGYDERFIRLWNYYLCYCEAAFDERAIGVVQMQFDKPECRRDPLDVGRAAARLRHERSESERPASDRTWSCVSSS
jgi:cyclopropane-fatty-acyl-phospholipid synthase